MRFLTAPLFVAVVSTCTLQEIAFAEINKFCFHFHSDCEENLHHVPGMIVGLSWPDLDMGSQNFSENFGNIDVPEIDSKAGMEKLCIL